MRNVFIWIAGLSLGGSLALVGSSSPVLAADPSGDGSCTTGTFSGDLQDGSWHRTFNPNCSNNTKATVDIEWHNYRATNGDEHFKYQAYIEAGPIASNNCVEIALDPNPPSGMHGDAQILRNCYENSTRITPWVDIDLQPEGDFAWPIQRLQVNVYDPDTGTVHNQACPGNVGLLTDGSNCTNWNPDAPWSSLGAKIFRRTNAGNDQQNDPVWTSTASNAYRVYQFTHTDQ